MCLAFFPPRVSRVHALRRQGQRLALGLRVAGSRSVMWLHHLPFIHPSAVGHLGCFRLLAILNNGAVHTRVQVFVWTHGFNSLEYGPRSRIAGPYGYSTLNVLRKGQTAFPGQRILSHPREGPDSSTPASTCPCVSFELQPS